MDKNEIQLAEFRHIAYSEGGAFEEHAGRPCADCQAEADYFLCAEGDPRPAKYDDTFLCADCCEARYWGNWEMDDETGDELPPTPDPFATPFQLASGKPREAWDSVRLDDGRDYEFGKLSCHEDCDVCN